MGRGRDGGNRGDVEEDCGGITRGGRVAEVKVDIVKEFVKKV